MFKSWFISMFGSEQIFYFIAISSIVSKNGLWNPSLILTKPYIENTWLDELYAPLVLSFKFSSLLFVWFDKKSFPLPDLTKSIQSFLITVFN